MWDKFCFFFLLFNIRAKFSWRKSTESFFIFFPRLPQLSICLVFACSRTWPLGYWSYLTSGQKYCHLGKPISSQCGAVSYRLNKVCHLTFGNILFIHWVKLSVNKCEGHQRKLVICNLARKLSSPGSQSARKTEISGLKLAVKKNIFLNIGEERSPFAFSVRQLHTKANRMFQKKCISSVNIKQRSG